MRERFHGMVGEDDAEQLRSLIGAPEAFTFAFEPAADGSSGRREPGSCDDLASAFEFIDGELLTDRAG